VQGEIGTSIGGFRIEAEIGRGGMGVVYLAEQESPRRKVALKILAPHLAGDPAFRERFQRETDAAASIEHPNVVPIYGAGEADGQLYLAMRYIEGTDLATLITEEGALAPDRAARICAQVAEALSAAHRGGIVHRDVKPGNVLVDAEDHGYLSDFGLVRQTEIGSGITKTGQLTGTVDYVAPEQIRGDPVDGRADLYSLGCVLFECLTGEPPFRRESEVATLYAHLESPTPLASERRPGVSSSLDAVVAKATAKRADERFATAHDFASAISVTFGGPPPPDHPPKRRRVLAVGAVGALAAVVIVAAVVALSGGDREGGGGAEDTPPAIPLHSLVKIDPTTGSVVGSPLPIPAADGADPEVRVGEGSVWVLSPSGGAATLTQVDPVDVEIVGDKTVPPSFTIVPDSLDVGLRTVWVGADPGIARFDPIDGGELRPVRLGQGGATVSVGGGRVWAATPRGTLYRVDPNTAVVEDEVEVDANAFDIAVGLGAVWIVDELASTVTHVDIETMSADPPIAIGGDLTDIEAGAGGVWIVDERGGVVVEVDPTTLRPLGPIRVGAEPTDAAVGLDAIWVTNRGDGTISRIDPVTGNVTDTIEIGAAVAAIDADEGSGMLWVVVSPVLQPG
jgi:streptogramin lyase/predicted Ser/Thr protein kinase